MYLSFLHLCWRAQVSAVEIKPSLKATALCQILSDLFWPVCLHEGQRNFFCSLGRAIRSRRLYRARGYQSSLPRVVMGVYRSRWRCRTERRQRGSSWEPDRQNFWERPAWSRNEKEMKGYIPCHPLPSWEEYGGVLWISTKPARPIYSTVDLAIGLAGLVDAQM